jgi:hypothetical protein
MLANNSRDCRGYGLEFGNFAEVSYGFMVPVIGYNIRFQTRKMGLMEARWGSRAEEAGKAGQSSPRVAAYWPGTPAL